MFARGNVLASAVAEKQPATGTDDLQISHVSGLQAAIDGAGTAADVPGDIPRLRGELDGLAGMCQTLALPY